MGGDWAVLLDVKANNNSALARSAQLFLVAIGMDGTHVRIAILC